MQRRSFIRSLVAVAMAPFVPVPVIPSTMHPAYNPTMKALMFGRLYGAGNKRLLAYCADDARLTQIATQYVRQGYAADKIFPRISEWGEP